MTRIVDLWSAYRDHDFLYENIKFHVKNAVIDLDKYRLFRVGESINSETSTYFDYAPITANQRVGVWQKNPGHIHEQWPNDYVYRELIT